jgi:hypothetical protein
MVWKSKENARKQVATDNPRMRTRGNTKEGRPKERWMDGWMDGLRPSMTKHGLTEDDRDREM